MAKSNQWIHGGRYIKPTSDGAAANRSSTPKHAQTNRRSEARDTLSDIWNHLKNVVGHIFPIVARIIKTIITFIIMMIGGIVYGIEMARAKAVAISTPGKPARQQQRQQHVQQQPPRSSSPVEIQRNSQIVSSVQPAPDNPTNRTSPTDLPPTQTIPTQTAPRATPAKSLLRKNSSRRDSFGSKEPRSARRVLFTETSEGEVHRTEVLYDKELPASARKVKVETKESLEARVVAARGRRDSFSPSKLVRGDQLRQATVADTSPSNMKPAAVTQRSPLATVNSLTSPMANNQQLVPITTKAPSPMKNNKRPAETKVMDINQKRRNLVAMSRYNNRNTRRPMVGLRPPNGVNKRQREEMEHLVWNAMNKKGKVEEESVRLDSKTPMKARLG